MEDKSYLHGIRDSLKESVDFFACQDKFIRESWVVANFLTNLSISFAETDLVRGGDPPDVMRLIETPLPDVTSLAALGYRSVSFLEGHRSCVLCADPNAPSFLHVQPGIIHRTAQ